MPPLGVTVADPLVPPLQLTLVCAVRLAENELNTVTFVVDTNVPQLLLTRYDIIVVPALMPATTPPVLTVPTAVLVLLHVPPATLLLKVVVDPAVTVFVPVVAGTDAGKTFNVRNARKLPQPVAV